MKYYFLWGYMLISFQRKNLEHFRNVTISIRLFLTDLFFKAPSNLHPTFITEINSTIKFRTELKRGVFF